MITITGRLGDGKIKSLERLFNTFGTLPPNKALQTDSQTATRLACRRALALAETSA